MYGKSVLFRRVDSFSVVFWRTKKDSTKRLLEFLADMPKAHSSRIVQAQRQRQQISKKGEKYGPSSVYLQVLGSGAHGAPSTLYMFTDQKRYLFNCGECTQRLAHEHKVKLSRLDHIFITSKTWRNIGGLPGLSLTLQDVGVPNIVLHGPDGLDELYNATKRFVIMKDMNVTMAKCSPIEDFDDSVMTVKYVLLGPHDDIIIKGLLKEPKEREVKRAKIEHVDKELEQFIKDDTDYYMHNEKRDPKAAMINKGPAKPRLSTDKRSFTEKEKDVQKMEQVFHQLQKKFTCSVAYICTLKKRLGTLNLERCVELGVKPGPMLGQLKNGHDVILPDGTLVRSQDVKTPDDPGPVFIVLDVPDVSYLKEADFAAHFADGSNPPENIPALVVHFTPPHVFHDPQYRSFMSRFGEHTRHLILNAQNSCLGSEAVHRTQHRLHLLDPDIFPLLKDVSVPAVWNSQPPLTTVHSPVRLKGMEELRNIIALAQFQSIVNTEGACRADGAVAAAEDDDKLEVTAGRTLTMFQLRPKKQLDRSQEPKLHIQDYIQETMDVPGFAESLEQFRKVVESVRYRQGKGKEYPKVVFLGTGSCIPSKTRNTSAIVLRVDEGKSILLDCGEGTFGQLVRFYGPKKVNGFLKTLRAIYISHLHADHHIGLIGVLQARRLVLQEPDCSAAPEPLLLLAPGQILSWLTLYDQQFERIQQDFTLVPNQNLLMGSQNHSHELTPAMLAHLGVESITTCPVAHCPNAFGVAIQAHGHKITYSGDTIPCEELVQLGAESDLLIHEATMEDELIEEARVKMHSTATQAIDIGRQMGARYTVLTHFSQRYARLPRLNANILNDNHSVGIAFDNMQVTMSDLELLPHMYAPLQLMFAEHCVEMELKAQHRARQKELSAVTAARARSQKSHSGSRSCSRSACGWARSCSSGHSLAFYRDTNASRLRNEFSSSTRSSRSTVKPELASTQNKPSPQYTTKTSTSRVNDKFSTRVRGQCVERLNVIVTNGMPMKPSCGGSNKNNSLRAKSAERQVDRLKSRHCCSTQPGSPTSPSRQSKSSPQNATNGRRFNQHVSALIKSAWSPTQPGSPTSYQMKSSPQNATNFKQMSPRAFSSDAVLDSQLKEQQTIECHIDSILRGTPPTATIGSAKSTTRQRGESIKPQHDFGDTTESPPSRNGVSTCRLGEWSVEDQIDYITIGMRSLSISKEPTTAQLEEWSAECPVNLTHSNAPDMAPQVTNGGGMPLSRLRHRSDSDCQVDFMVSKRNPATGCNLEPVISTDDVPVHDTDFKTTNPASTGSNKMEPVKMPANVPVQDIGFKTTNTSSTGSNVKMEPVELSHNVPVKLIDFKTTSATSTESNNNRELLKSSHSVPVHVIDLMMTSATSTGSNDMEAFKSPSKVPVQVMTTNPTSKGSNKMESFKLSHCAPLQDIGFKTSATSTGSNIKIEPVKSLHHIPVQVIDSHSRTLISRAIQIPIPEHKTSEPKTKTSPSPQSFAELKNNSGAGKLFTINGQGARLPTMTINKRMAGIATSPGSPVMGRTLKKTNDGIQNVQKKEMTSLYRQERKPLWRAVGEKRGKSVSCWRNSVTRGSVYAVAKKPSWNHSTNLNSMSTRSCSPDAILRNRKTNADRFTRASMSPSRPRSPKIVLPEIRSPVRGVVIAPARTMMEFRDRLRESLKQDPEKNYSKSHQYPKRTGGLAPHSVLSFTPQLEEIKSSFYLLNKKINKTKEQPKKLQIQKPKPVDENERRTKLREAKAQFQNKDYVLNSKYDHIEGLNWITWKHTSNFN